MTSVLKQLQIFSCRRVLKLALMPYNLITIITQDLGYQIKQRRILMQISTKFLRFAFSMPKFDPKRDYYKALNLSSSATPQQIKKAFKQYAKKYHPDVNKGKQELFKQVNEAYQILSDKSLKKQYDQSRKEVKNQKAFYQNVNKKQYQRREEPSQNHYNSYEQQDPLTQAEIRQQIRRQNQQMMKKYTQNRNNYDNLGRAYQNYEKFAQETLKKKVKFQQKDRVTQQSVRMQEDRNRRQAERREEEQFIKKRQELKKSIQQKYDRAFKNTQNMFDGVKKMSDFVKDIFKKK